MGFPPNDNRYHWWFEEVSDLDEGVVGSLAGGLPGQGENSNPASIFKNHQVALLNGVYYDPSYGKKYNSLTEFENQAISRYSFNNYEVFSEADYDTDFNGDGDKDDGVGATPEDVFASEVFNIRENPPLLMLLQELPTNE